MKKLLSLIIILLLIVIILLIFIPPEKITLQDISLPVPPQSSPKKPAIEETLINDSPETQHNDIVKVDYYIIVGSFRNMIQAQQKAEKLLKNFKTDFIVLPATKEGYYRISGGKYSTLEEAKAKINGIRTNIDSEAWIYSVKE